MTIGILGYGQIGKSIYQFIPQAIVGTKTRKIDKHHFDVLHVCIPYQHDFVSIVNKHKADLIIIHSTVPVGTTKKIHNAVHSPCRGKHPNLKESLEVFVKFVGSDNAQLGKKAVEHLKDIGIRYASLVRGTKTTELGKLLDTTYYGVCIEYHRYANELCKKYGVSFDDVMTNFNKSYNIGYMAMSKSQFVRPILYPPKGKIGGHCVLPNAKLLPKQFSPKRIWTDK